METLSIAAEVYGAHVGAAVAHYLGVACECEYCDLWDAVPPKEREVILRLAFHTEAARHIHDDIPF